MTAQTKLRLGQGGFTLVELMVVIAVIGILAGVALPNFIGVNEKLDVAQALDADRDLQTIAIIDHTADGVAPSNEKLANEYSRKGAQSIAGKFRIYSANEAGQELGARFFVICSTMPLKNAAYVYSLDDKPPQIAAKGTDPMKGACGPGAALDGVTEVASNSGGSGSGGDSSGGSSSGGDSGSAGSPPPSPPQQPVCNSCPVNDLCPCSGGWKNHGEYVTCVVKVANECYKSGKIGFKEYHDLKQGVGNNDCGKKK